MLDRLEGKSTRSEVLRFIKIKGSAAIQDLSRALGITSMGVRRHMRLLQGAGFIRTEKTRQGRGRPADLYFLTDLGDGLFPKAYDRFSRDLIRSVVVLDGASKLEQLFETRKDHLLEQFAGRMAGKIEAARIQETVAILCEEGYMAECCRLNPGTFLLTSHNCPIAHIAREYPQVCQTELGFLAQMIGADVRRESHALNGDSKCSYLIQFPANRKVSATEC